MKKQLYLFSGLGADERIFHTLDLTDFSVTFVKWISPVRRESIQAYAARLLEQIKSKNPVLIGLSFGGIMAVEIAKLIETEKVILISSAKTHSEIPVYFRMAGWMRIHRLVPVGMYKNSHLVSKWIFGTKTNPHSQLLYQILKDTDPVFLKWAIDKVVNWRNKTIAKNVFHIHGSHDRLLPHRFVKCHVTIDKGGHLITLSQPEDLNRILREQIIQMS